MTTNNLSLEQAINDLSTIKRAIEVSSHKDGIPKDHSAFRLDESPIFWSGDWRSNPLI